MANEDNPDSAYPPTTDVRYRKTLLFATAGVALIAVAGLAGYLPGLRVLGSIGYDYVPMAPATALCFLAFSLALFLVNRTPDQVRQPVAMTALVLLGAVFSLLEFIELLVGVDLNYSSRVFPLQGMVGNIPIGQMSPVTAAGFSISGAGVLLLTLRRPGAQRTGQLENWTAILGAVTTLVGSTFLLAYLYGNPLMYGGGAVPMAATTALAFLLLGMVLVISAGPENVLLRRVTGDSTSALLSRLFIPLVVMAVLLQSVLSRYVAASSLVNEAVIMAVVVVLLVMVTAYVVDYVAGATGGKIDEINGRLQQTLTALQESEENHRDILQTAMDGVILAYPEGRIKDVNEAYCRMSGYSREELLGMNLLELTLCEAADEVDARIRDVLESGEARFETRHRRKDGYAYDVEASIKYRPKGGHLVVFLRDVSERKLREEAHQQAGNLLQLASTDSDLHECVSALAASLRSWSGCEAVGIRLRDGDDFPYLETSGFPAAFVEAENHLCCYAPDGGILRDGVGNPVLECMCGNVLSGRYDPSKPFFTHDGSFWTNNTTELLAGSSEADRMARTRNRCNGEGYQSVALIPMHTGDGIVGLLQFNDRRPDRFTPVLIDIFEAIADKLALAMTRRKAERELHRKEKLHRDLLNTIPDLIWLKDVNGVYLSCNSTFERFFGAREADIVGKNDYDFMDSAEAEFFRGHDRRAMDAGAPTSNEEWITFADDGHRALLYTTKMPMYGSQGELIGILGIGRDITKLREAEDAVRESESRLRYALEGTNDGLWDVQLSTGKVYLSPRGCEILGYCEAEGSELAGVWSDLVHPEDLRVTEERLQAHLTGQAPIFEVEQRLKTKGGDWKWILTRGKVVERDAEGTPIRITGTHSDITEKKLLEAQLQQAQKMESVGRLAGGVAHDFNNMLGVIIGHTSLALMETAPAEPAYTHFIEINSAAERSADLTRQLLAFARKQTIAPKVLDLNDVVSGMLKMLQRLIGEDTSICWQPGTRLWPVKVDPSQVDQILANLCVNARDAIESNGKIVIETGTTTIDRAYCNTHTEATQGEYVWLSVSDNGRGMNKETIAHIYEPFFTTKALGEGTGLGLATVYGAVKQNDGFINVYSEPGLGTIFTIHIPRYQGGKTEQQLQESELVPPSRGNETVLLVEDEPGILYMSRMILENQGYLVYPAGTVSEAIRLAREYDRIDLLMTDVVMPEMNGWDLAAMVKKGHPRIKTLFMSGYTADVIANHGILDDGVHFIQKPFSLHALSTKVRQVLDGRETIAFKEGSR